jgi:hypothetical protein
MISEGTLLRNNKEKKKRGYTNEKSIVWMDGREKLYKEDWIKRKEELFTLCGGRCQHVDPCPSFGTVDKRCAAWFRSLEEMDAHHVQKRSKQRDDRLANLKALCRFHHRQLDPRVTRFGESLGDA